MAEWASRKGFLPVKDFSQAGPVSQHHAQCFPSDGTRAKWKPPTHHLKQQQPPSSNPWTIFTGRHPEKPDLRNSIIMTERSSSSSRQLEYVTKWDRTPHRLPDLPTDILKRVLFPKAFPSRISSSRHFEPWGITEVQHRRYRLEKTTSPWTEVAMHLAEALEPGHYWSLPACRTCTHIWNAHIWLWIKRHFATPTTSAQRDTNATFSPMLCSWKVRKTWVNWVTCHPWIFALSTIPLRDRLRDPGELLSAAGVATAQRHCVLLSRFFFTVRSASHHNTHVHAGPSGPKVAKEAPFTLTLHLM